MNTTIGTCSCCGGRVSVPTVWGGVIPPVPTCESCGALPAQPHGPVINMRPLGLRDGQTYVPGTSYGKVFSLSDMLREFHGGGSGG